MHWQQKFSVDAEAVRASEIRELLKILADPSILSFAGGIPDPALFPMGEFSAILAELQAQPDLYRQSMQYSATEGYAPLRAWISETFSSQHTSLSPHNVLITNGAQQSLTLLATALISPGDAIAVANPTYLGALQVFGIRRPRYLTIATDDHGLTVDGVEAAFKQGVKFLYTVPDFQNPGGMTLAEDRRLAIVELAHRYDVAILEDTAYRSLYYDAPPPLSLLDIEGQHLGSGQWQASGRVVQLGTASKTLMPALRVGWTIAPQPLIDKLVQLKQANDLHTSTFNQVLTNQLARTVLPTHLKALRSVYAARRDAMVETLQRHLPNGVHFTAPQGGMFVWLTLPEHMDARDLLTKALDELKLAFVPGAPFHANGGGQNTLRLSFTGYEPPVIHDAMKRLCALISREYLAEVPL